MEFAVSRTITLGVFQRIRHGISAESDAVLLLKAVELRERVEVRMRKWWCLALLILRLSSFKSVSAIAYLVSAFPTMAVSSVRVATLVHQMYSSCLAHCWSELGEALASRNLLVCWGCHLRGILRPLSASSPQCPQGWEDYNHLSENVQEQTKSSSTNFWTSPPHRLTHFPRPHSSTVPGMWGQ